ncbi:MULTISPECIES: PrgI family protein [Helcococcus]|uniref:PrgI family protein n=1 Tax=Helcococcus bovis TaxID=3153252 RepID=A0ABW9F757_9FIRM
MAFAKIPKDINLIETKLVGNFTKRQVITMSIASAISVPLFTILNSKFGSGVALYGLFLTSFPIFFLGFYKKNNEYIDVKLLNIINRVILNKQIRVYKSTTNLEILEKINFVQNEQNRKGKNVKNKKKK